MITQRQWWSAGVLFTFALLLDRVTKIWALLMCQSEQEITSFLATKCMLNRGISWGLLQSDNGYIFAAVSVMIALFIGIFTWWVYRHVHTFGALIGVSLVLSGAVSNFFDRLWYSGVIDFIAVSYRGWSFLVFNIADVAICFGVVILFLTSYGDSSSEEKV